MSGSAKLQEPGLDKTPPLRGVLLAGAVWMAGVGWAIKVAGFVSTMILARLLTPEDFGLVAMAMVVVAFSGVLFKFGTEYALISNPDATEMHYNAAWTMRVIQGGLAAGLIALAAPIAAEFYKDDRVLDMLLLLSAGVFLRAFANIGVVDFRKKLQFSIEFYYLVSVKILTIPLTIGLALWLRNFWALILGILISYLLELVLSYRLHPFRPKLSLRGGSLIWAFSKWMVVYQIATFFTMKVDRLVLGGLTSPTQIGLYSLSGEIAHLPSTEIVAPVSRAVVPGFAKLQVEPSRLNAAFLKTVAAVSTIAIPAAFGLSLVASDVVPLVLGTQWLSAIPLLQWLAVHGALLAMFSICANLLMVTQEIRWAAAIAAARAVVFLIALYPAFAWYGLVGVIIVKLASSAVGVVAIWFVISSKRGVSLGKMLRQIWRPGVGTLIMVFAVIVLPDGIGGGAFLSLLFKATTGIIVYSVVVLGLWKMFGGKNDIEADVLGLLRRKLAPAMKLVVRNF